MAADKKFTELDALTAPNNADLLAIVDDVSGTPIIKKIVLSDLMKGITVAGDLSVVGDFAVNEDVQLGLSETLITNGDFTGNADGWSLGGTWAYNSNNIIVTGNGSQQSAMSSVFTLISGKKYRLTYEVVSNSKDFTNFFLVRNGFADGDGNVSGGVNTYIAELTADASTGSFTFVETNSSTSGTMVIDNVSLVQIGNAEFGNDVLVNGNVTFVGTTINMTTSGTVLTVGVGADNGTVSAGVFTDRTPFYDGDALTVIKNIKGKDGRIDHLSLPTFVQSHKTKDIFEKKSKKDEFDEFILDDEGNQILEDVKIGTEDYIERNIGNMISVNVKAFQQLIAINEDLTKRIEKLEKP